MRIFGRDPLFFSVVIGVNYLALWSGFYHWRKWTCYPVSLPQGTSVTTDLNCSTVLLTCELSGVKGRCLVPFLFLTLCQDSSHEKKALRDRATFIFQLRKSLDLNRLLQRGDPSCLFFLSLSPSAIIYGQRGVSKKKKKNTGHCLWAYISC